MSPTFCKIRFNASSLLITINTSPLYTGISLASVCSPPIRSPRPACLSTPLDILPKFRNRINLAMAALSTGIPFFLIAAIISPIENSLSICDSDTFFLIFFLGFLRTIGNMPTSLASALTTFSFGTAVDVAILPAPVAPAEAVSCKSLSFI